MAVTNGPNLGLAVNGAQGDQHFTQLMAQWRGLDALVQAHVKSRTTTAQPASPADGDCYIIPSGATGTAWSGQTNKIGRYTSVTPGWEFYTPKKGWRANVEDLKGDVQYDGAAWMNVSQSAVAGLTADQTLANATTTKILINTTISDADGIVDTANSKIIPKAAGTYLVIATLSFAGASGVAGERLISYIYKNGVSFVAPTESTHTLPTNNVQAIALVPMNGSTDYLELYARRDTTAAYQISAAGTQVGLVRVGP